MAERVFCVDFGSAYTKVALRRDPEADSALLPCGGGDLDFWVPTVVLVDRRGTEPKLEFGYQAAGRAAGGGIDIYANFKKDLFTAPAPASDKPRASPLDALLQSDEFAALAAKYSVSQHQVAALRTMAGSARTLVGTPGERVVSLEAHRQANAVKLVYNFFVWLRKQVLDACGRLGAPGLKFEEFPVRVAVPALTPDGNLADQPSCKLLREALHRAGWPIHTEQPFVTEPEANAVGILTQADNSLNRRRRINLGAMFNKGPLMSVLKGDVNYPTYRALVIDVGAFTTDFAALTVDTDGKPFVPETGAGFRTAKHSVAFGVSDLDARVREAVPKEKREWLERASRKEFESFQEGAYSPGRGYRVPGVGVFGGDTDGETDACVTEFGNRLMQEIAKFCADHQPAKMQELIITGGGASIPKVRDALIAAAQACGNTFVKIHAPDLKRGRTGSGPLVDKLDDQFTRGGSAIGGASIYFERSYYS